MAKGAEQGRAVVSARKDRISTKKQKEKADTESSSDSDVERAAEAEAKRSREKERKRRLTDAEADGEAVDRQIAEAEAKNQAALLCKPREIESSGQIVALKSLGTTVASITDVVLSRARLPFLDEFCKELKLSNEPEIFQIEADTKAKKNSVLGRGQHPAEVALLWILGEMLFHFFVFNTLALLIVCCLAENLPYFGRGMDLSLGYNMAEDTMQTIQFETSST